MEKISAFIAMKGVSERVPNKNITDINGKPLFYYIIDALLNVEYVDDILVDTDSEEIAELVVKYFTRVNIHMRSTKLLMDCPEIINLLLEDNFSRMKHKNILQTHSTNPLLTKETIEDAIVIYFNNLGVYDSLFSVTPVMKRFFDKDGNPINHDPNLMIRTQDLSPIYEENSCIYILSHESFKKNKKRIGAKPLMYEMDGRQSIDIDTEFELDLVRYIIEKGNANDKM